MLYFKQVFLKLRNFINFSNQKNSKSLSPLNLGTGLLTLVLIFAFAPSSTSQNTDHDCLILPLGIDNSVNQATIDRQESPDIGMDADGNFVVVWQSKISSSWEVYARRYDSDGIPFGDEFQVNENVSGNQDSPVIAMNDAGDYVIAWYNQFEIHAKKFNADGTPFGAEFMVNAATVGSEPEPVIAINNSGEFVIAWVSNESGSSLDVIVQSFDSNCNKIGGPQAVNTNLTNIHWEASLGIDEDANFVVAWEAFNQINSLDIFARRYDSNANPIGDEFIVNEHTTGIQGIPHVQMHGNGSFIIAFLGVTAASGATRKITTQRYDTNGMADGGNQVFDVEAETTQDISDIIMEENGALTVVWALDYGEASGNDVYFQQFDENGQALANFIMVNNYTNGSQFAPKIAKKADKEFIVVFGSQHDGDLTGVFMQRLACLETCALPDLFSDNSIDVSTDLNASHDNPEIAINSSDRFVIVWESTDNSDIYARIYDENENPIGPEFIVNTITNGIMTSPKVAMKEDGEFIVTWVSENNDNPDMEQDIKAQMFAANGTKIGTEFFVNTNTSGDQFYPSIAISVTNEFMISWQSTEASTFDKVFAQAFDSNGNKVGTQFQVNDTNAEHQRLPLIAYDKNDDNFVIVWTFIHINTENDIIGKKYSTAGLQQGGVFNILPEGFEVFHLKPDFLRNISIDDNGNMFISAYIRVDGMYFFHLDNNHNCVPFFGDNSSRCHYFYSELTSASTIHTNMDKFGNIVAVLQVSDFITNYLQWNAKGILKVNKRIASSSPGYSTSQSKTVIKSDNSILIVQKENGSNQKIIIKKVENCISFSNEEICPTTEAETRVNTTIAGDQKNPYAAMDNNNYIVVWESDNAIRGQRFNNSGQKEGSELEVSSSGINPIVQLADNGDFIIAWEDADNSNLGIYVQYYLANGTPSGTPFLVSTNITIDNQLKMQMGIDASNNYVLVWETFEGGKRSIYCKRYDASGNVLNEESRVNINITDNNSIPSISMAKNGQFIISFFDSNSCRVRKYNNAGIAQGTDFFIASTSNSEFLAFPVLFEDGSFQISFFGENCNSSNYPQTNHYDNQNVLQGNPDCKSIPYTFLSYNFDINTNLFVLYEGFHTTYEITDPNLYLQNFAADGIFIGNEMQCNYDEFSTPVFSTNQRKPHLASNDQGDVLVVWTSENQDGFGTGVYSKLYKGDSNNNGICDLNDPALPLEWLDFQAKLTEKNQVALTWQTASEIDNDYFTVQRSKDGQTFEDLSQVPANKNANVYDLVDAHPFSNKNYYRIQQTDINGKKTWTDIKLVLVPEHATLSIHPNPFSDVVQLQWQHKEVTYIQVVDNLGRVVLESYPEHPSEVHLNLANFPVGIYIVQLKTSQGWISEKIVKQ